MARNIVLCLDGTSNQYSATNTNVVKLYAMLDRARNDQLSYYQPGMRSRGYCRTMCRTPIAT